MWGEGNAMAVERPVIRNPTLQVVCHMTLISPPTASLSVVLGERAVTACASQSCWQIHCGEGQAVLGPCCLAWYVLRKQQLLLRLLLLLLVVVVVVLKPREVLIPKFYS